MKLELSLGILVTEEPVPAYDLLSKLNEAEVTLYAVWFWIVEVVVVASATFGLKSTVSLKSYSPVGSATSGSTLVAEY